jgi:hypothetical protein
MERPEPTPDAPTPVFTEGMAEPPEARPLEMATTASEESGPLQNTLLTPTDPGFERPMPLSDTVGTGVLSAPAAPLPELQPSASTMSPRESEITGTATGSTAPSGDAAVNRNGGHDQPTDESRRKHSRSTDRDKKEKKERKEKKDKRDKKARSDDAAIPGESESPQKSMRRSKSHRSAANANAGVNGGVSPPRTDEEPSKPPSDTGTGDIFHLKGVPQVAVHMGDNRLVVHVKSMGPLSANVDITHPFIRAWVVDGKNGESLATGTAGEALSAATHPYDLRSHRSIAPSWQEQIALDLAEPFSDAESPMLLVELLDFGTTNIRGEPKSEDGFPWGLYPIAWGFLQLSDMYGRANLRRDINIQLFRSPERRGWARSMWVTAKALVAPTPQSTAKAGWAPPQSLDTRRIPAVFRNMLNFVERNDEYDATLTVQAFLTDDTHEMVEPPGLLTKDRLLNEELYHLMAIMQNQQQQLLRGAPSMSQQRPTFVSYSQEGRGLGRRGGALAEQQRRRHAELMRRDFTRSRYERCLPPKSELHSVRCAARVSAMAFSPDGEMLAVAVVSDLVATIRLVHATSPKADTVGDLKGHVGYIHTLAFSRDGRLLLSCSADKTVRVWDLSSLPVYDVPPIHILGHPGHVYGAVFLNQAIITGGVDGHLALWTLPDGSLRCRTPNSAGACFRAVVAGPQSHSSHKVWTLDSVGNFSAWRAIADESGKVYTRLEPRRRLQVPGATRVHIASNTALLYVPSDDPVFVVVDLIAFTPTRTVSIGNVPANLRSVTARLPTALLPDAKTAVIALSAANVLAFDLTLGELFTSNAGFPFVPDKKMATQLAWSPTRHMAAMAYINVDGPMGATVTIVGRPRVDGEECIESDPQSLNVLRHLYGGEVKLGTDRPAQKPSAATLSRSIVPVTPRRSSLSRPAVTVPTHGTFTGDIQSRFNQIINWWKGQVQAHAGRGGVNTTEPTAAGRAIPVDLAVQPPATNDGAAGDANDGAATATVGPRHTEL